MTEKIVPLSIDYPKEKKITKEKIEAKNIKSEKNTEVLDKTKYTKYGLIGFCILLLVLFLIKKRTRKTEFEK